MTELVRPAHLSDYAERTLLALAVAGLGHVISVGGALGLLHYIDYRTTHDVDAWWSQGATPEERARVLAVVEATLLPFGEVRTRQWGEVVSLDLKVGGKAVFSFQIASRSAQLQPATSLPWGDVSLDSLPDLVASKMTALVERGAPRDFRDIFSICHAGLMTPADCWRLWRQRQQLAGSDIDPERARLAIESHLSRIVQHRSLAAITDPEQKAEAGAVRSWFNEELLHVRLD